MKFLGLFIALILLSPPGWGDLPSGSKRVWFETGGGESLELGTLEIKREGEHWRFSFAPRETNFSDQFLSMRPFKCIDGKPMYCHLVYPYDKAQIITADDLVNLEYEFLFIVRASTEYGIDPYNGRYYVFRLEEGNLIGEPKAVDLNILAAPPDAGVTRPITEAELDFIEVEAERFTRLIIR